MAGKSTAWLTAALLLEFNNTNAANVGDATGLRGSSTVGSDYLALHTASPGRAGNQSTNEVSYTGYARQPVARSGAGYTVSGASVVLAATVSFPSRTDSGAAVEATHFSIGSDVSGSGNLRRYGPLVGANLAYLGVAVTSGNLFTAPGSAYSVGDRVLLSAAAQSSMPGGFTDETVYYVKTASGDTFTLSATNGGTVITVSADGACMVQKLSTITIGQNTVPQLTTSTTITEG